MNKILKLVVDNTTNEKDKKHLWQKKHTENKTGTKESYKPIKIKKDPDLKKYVDSRESWYGFLKSKLTRKNSKIDTISNSVFEKETNIRELDTIDKVKNFDITI